MADLNIRDFPVELLRRARARAAIMGKTLKQWVIEVLYREMERRP